MPGVWCLLTACNTLPFFSSLGNSNHGSAGGFSRRSVGPTSSPSPPPRQVVPPSPHPSWLTAFSIMLHAEIFFLPCTHFALHLCITHSTWHGEQGNRMCTSNCDLVSVLGKVTLPRCTHALWPQTIPKSDACHCCLMLGLPWFLSASGLLSFLGPSLWPPHHAGWGPLHEGPGFSSPVGSFLPQALSCRWAWGAF